MWVRTSRKPGFTLKHPDKYYFPTKTLIGQSIKRFLHGIAVKNLILTTTVRVPHEPGLYYRVKVTSNQSQNGITNTLPGQSDPRICVRFTNKLSQKYKLLTQ